MKRMMIGAATAIALLAGPALAASSGSIADSPAATSAGVNDAAKNPPCVPGSNDVACGNATSGSSGTSGTSDAMGSGASGSATGGAALDNGAAPGVDRKKAPGLSDTPTSTSGSGSNGG